MAARGSRLDNIQRVIRIVQISPVQVMCYLSHRCRPLGFIEHMLPKQIPTGPCRGGSLDRGE
jgi:hypothetical protein